MLFGKMIRFNSGNLAKLINTFNGLDEEFISGKHKEI